MKVFRKAAFQVVKDLGEEASPDKAATPSVDAETSTVEAQVPPPAITSETSVAEDDFVTTPEAQNTEYPAAQRTVTTEERKPLDIPKSVHLRVTPENLKDFVGPPVYHKDRFYTHAPPPGVSTGLGYTGNGSGSVMPVEASVSDIHA